MSECETAQTAGGGGKEISSSSEVKFFRRYHGEDSA